MQRSYIRKPISVLLSILMVLSVFGGMAFTASAESSGTYNGFSWTLGDDGALSITGSGSIDSNAAWNNKGEITSISATGEIEQINRDAFFGNQNVTSYTVESTTDLKISQDAFFVYPGSKMETITITAPKITLTNNLYYNYDEPMELIFNGDVYLNPGAFSDVQTFSVHFNNNLYVVIPAGYYVFSGPGANELQSWYSYVARSKEEHPEHPEDYEQQLSDILASADERGCTYTKYDEETTIPVNEETIGQVFGSTYVAAQPNCGANGTKAYYVGAGVWDDSVGDFVDTYYLYENGTYFLVTADDLVMAPTGEHDYTDVEWTQADENNHERTCTVCGQTATEAHNWTWKIDTPADCGHDGTKHQECTVCGAVQAEGTVIEATGQHTAGEPEINTKPATCDEDGYTITTTKCAVCGEVLESTTLVIPATGKAAFEAYKAEKKAAVEAMAEEGDSTDAQQIIADAAAAIEALTYDEAKTLDANKAAVDALANIADRLAAQRAAEAAAAADQAAADEVIAKIDAIGEVEYTDESKAKIDAAREAYDALTDTQKALVTNAQTLNDAEARYNELKAQAEQGETDPTAPDNGQDDGLCKWCGDHHTGFWGRILGFFHSILYFFAHLFGRR